MSSSTQSQLEGAKAQRPQLSRVLEAERDKPGTVVKDHETQIERLQQSFKERHQSIILDAEKAFKASAEARCDLERKLQEEKQRVNELAGKLDETKHKEMTVKLASEKVNHGLTRIALNKSKGELDMAKSQVAVLTGVLNVVERQASELRGTLDDVRSHKDQVQTELDLSKGESAEIQQRLKAAEQRNVDLETDLKAATRRAEGAEGELQAFKSRFQQINDLMTTLASPSDKQPIVAQSTSPAPTSNDQGSVEQREPGPQTNDAPVPPQSPGLQANNTASDNESDMLHCKSTLDEVMDTTKNWDSNQFFLKAMDSLTLASRDAKVGPMNLGTMKEKLAKGAYNSVTSFKAHFDLMITDARTMNPPRNCVRIAAEQLSKIFDQAFSSRSVPGHEPRETARSAQDTNDKKRKAATDTMNTTQDEPAQKRRSLAPTEQSTEPVQRGIPGARASLTPASTASGQSKDATQDPELNNADHVKGQITTGTRLGIDVTLSAVAQLVSYTKSPSTITGDWKSLVPGDYWITAHALPEKVEHHIGDIFHSSSSDMITLRLLPAAGADKPEFNRFLEYLVQRERFATVSHFGVDSVRDVYLIPSSKKAFYPKFLLGLDRDLLPPAKAEDVLFMVIVFIVADDKRIEFRSVWDRRLAAIRNHDNAGLTSLRNVLKQHPILIFSKRTRIVTSARRFLTYLDDLPYSDKKPSPELRAYVPDLLQISYTKLNQGMRPSVAGVTAPEWVFVLGRVVGRKAVLGLLVVDIQGKDRPLWLIRYFSGPTHSHRAIILLTGKFPVCLKEWEEAISPSSRKLTDARNHRIRDPALKLMRCRLLAEHEGRQDGG